MKKIALVLSVFAFFIGCVPKNKVVCENKTELKPEKNDDGEWDLQVIDTQYDYFLNAIAKPMNFYSESYLKTKNAFLVVEMEFFIPFWKISECDRIVD
ncbi:DUF6146 family protein [Halpernia sp. GG3]